MIVGAIVGAVLVSALVATVRVTTPFERYEMATHGWVLFIGLGALIGGLL